MREYAGPGYGESPERQRPDKPINMIGQAVNAYMMLLSGSLPQAQITSAIPALAPFALHYQNAVNNLLKRINFGQTHYEWVMNGFFMAGVLKVHMADSGELISIGDMDIDPGRPHISTLSLDNFVYDTSAKTVSQAKFLGDMYRVPFKALKDESVYDQSVVNELELRPTSKAGAEGERLEMISLGREVDDDEFEPMIDLADIYVAADRCVYTFALRSRGQFRIHNKSIAKMDWIGTSRGPYRMLGFIEVPDNIMTVSPAAQLAPLDKLINNLMNKQSRQARRQKENPVYTPAGADDARNLRQAADGEWVSVQDPTQVSVVRQGGPNAENQGFMLNSIDIFDRLAGNLPAMLGLGTSADTVGQEKLIHASSSRMEGKMQRRVIEETASAIKELAFLLWHDEHTEIPGQVGIDGFPDYVAESNWVPGDREGEFDDYEFHIDVHSLVYRAPTERVQQINMLLGQIYAPLLQMMQEQGGTIDFNRLTQIYAELLNLPQLKEIVVFTAPLGEPEMSAADGPAKPATTERRYVRQDAGRGSGGSAGSGASQWQGGGMGAPTTLQQFSQGPGRGG